MSCTHKHNIFECSKHQIVRELNHCKSKLRQTNDVNAHKSFHRIEHNKTIEWRMKIPTVFMYFRSLERIFKWCFGSLSLPESVNCSSLLNFVLISDWNASPFNHTKFRKVFHANEHFILFFGEFYSEQESKWWKSTFRNVVNVFTIHRYWQCSTTAPLSK